MRRFIKSACIAGLMLLLLLCPAGCTKEVKQEESAVTLTALQYELENQGIDFGDLWFFKQLEEKTGVHVDFAEVKEVDWETRISLMFASGRYKDMILRGSLNTEEYGVTQGLLLPLDDYLAEHMPNYFSRLKQDGVGDAIPPPTGKATTLAICCPRISTPTGIFSSTVPGWTSWDCRCLPPLRS